jgi:hypothetical protein
VRKVIAGEMSLVVLKEFMGKSKEVTEKLNDDSIKKIYVTIETVDGELHKVEVPDGFLTWEDHEEE